MCLLYISDDYFQIGRNFKAAFAFRTTKFNGILITVSSPQGYPAMTLDLHEGQVYTIKFAQNFFVDSTLITSSTNSRFLQPNLALF